MLSKEQKGVYLTNSCLRQVLKVEKVHETSINDFAGKVSHLFPYKKIKKDYDNLRNELILMVVKEDSIKLSECEKFLSLPSLEEMEKVLKIEIIKWETNDRQAFRTY